MLTVISSSAAERCNSPHLERNHAKRRSYVARLKAGPRDSIDREFVERQKDGSRIRFDVAHKPGDIYEIRRWLWDGDRQTFMGGGVWIGFDEENRPFALTREEAIASVIMAKVETSSPASRAPAVIRPERILPSDIMFSCSESDIPAVGDEWIVE